MNADFQRLLAKGREPAVFINFAALGVIGVSGALLNVVVGSIWGSSTLGVFNQVFAVYLLAGQLGVIGLQNAALQHGAANLTQLSDVACASLILCASIALPVAVLLWLGSGAIGYVLDSAPVRQGIALVAPGVLFFAINKVALALLNAAGRMVWYGLLQALRVVAILALVGAAAIFGIDGVMLPLAFVGAELVVLFILAGWFVRPSQISITAASAWFKRILLFGIKSAPATSFNEINYRVDTLVLGVFVGDRVVGVYSLASTLVEGLMQGLIVIRTLVASALVEALQEPARKTTAELIRWTRRASYLLFLVVAILALPVYWAFLDVTGLMTDFSDSILIFAILIAGPTLAAGYIPLGTILMFAGRPFEQSVLAAIILAANTALNFALTAPFGAIGAATATASANVFAAALLHLLIKRRLGLAF
ncbi:oligosaccharide flippase family protein [Bradyrhizobium sp. AUGA SZCCT0240]|uniref:oligosaccharide flippase family protein n=1 Tax=Bradyrhizobium sp. AUGA SZCCT0240 TaxID=2807669 RepID=UPI001BAB29FE|nr:oligosaccharide flippase family protein [Bradyrhizobium sp. AUGA SZCCT0240]MBR1257953.1 oligosaccharide flippase family protein [Bradyrhizobium sp. AUGA SZCCT0240]